jgi:hypothetical protein
MNIENITYFFINQKFNPQPEASNKQLELVIDLLVSLKVEYFIKLEK